MKIDPEKYDYIMYVDASGDDGFKFEKDSSVCYAAAALLVKQEDIEHNIEILNRIKYIVGCKEKDEVKYSKVRRHRRSAEALSLLTSLKGNLSCHVVFKKEVDQAEYIGNKLLSVVCHAMALNSLSSYEIDDDKTILVAIDRMKHTEEEPLKKLLDSNHREATVVFRDSKDANYLLIQIADLLAGAIREHFEQYRTQPDMLYFAKKCPPCGKLRERNKVVHPLCRHGRSRAAKAISSSSFRYVFPLYPCAFTARFLRYFFVSPSEIMDRFYYLVCGFKK